MRAELPIDETQQDEAPANGTSSDSPSEQPKKLSWPAFIRKSKETEIKERFCKELADILKSHPNVVENYCCLALLAPQDFIDRFEADRIFRALSKANAKRERDVLLIVLSPGGRIEPAYQISKLCKSCARDRFVAVVPRHAKSAATLIAIGADEIHMGPLGQLGPIDPQLGDLPALGVVQALERIASISSRHPRSADMFARYLRLVLTVEQIGYCERIGESAVQYASRLLSTKPFLADSASQIAKLLVYEYKDHGFVIDFEEARSHLGDNWVRTDTAELDFAEDVYHFFEEVGLYVSVLAKSRLEIVGRIESDVMILRDLEND